MTSKFLTAGAVAAAVGAGLAAAQTASAARAPKRPEVTSMETPLGLQGTSGAGRNIPVIFRLFDRAGRATDVEVQYGADLNADGNISDDEYRPVTEDRLDPRNTRRDRRPQLFTSGRGESAVHSFVWNSVSDQPSGRFAVPQYALTAQGRRVADPDRPGEFLLATGQGGNLVAAGVKLRMRTAGRGNRHANWAYTNAFSLDNDAAPSMTLDAVALAADDSTTVHVDWTAFDFDSEDANGNGLLDLAEREDRNDNGVLDVDRVGVAFDFRRLAANEDPVLMTPAQLSQGIWKPCSRNAEDPTGQTDSLDLTPGQAPTGGVASAPPGIGRHWRFAWDAAADFAVTGDRYIVRATPFDEHGARGTTVYSRTVVTPAKPAN